MSEDERVVRHHLRPAPWAEEALDRLLSSARAEGYARAREQAACIAEASRAEAEAFLAAGTTRDGAQALMGEVFTAAEIRNDIRAMQDGVDAVDGAWCSCRRAMRDGPYGEECSGCGRPEYLCDCAKVGP